MLAEDDRLFITVEMNTGQMVEDVSLAVNGKSEVLFYGRPGGVVFAPEEISEKIRTVSQQRAERRGRKIESFFFDS